MYSFVDADSNLVTRNYYLNDSKVDVRFGSAIKNKFGLGNMILGLDLLVGYSKLNDNMIEYKTHINDTMYYGRADSLTTITTMSYPSVDYGNLGLDISLAYQLNLGNNFLLNLEYAPEVNFNFLIKKKGDIHSSEYDYSDYYLDVAFNRFYIMLLYKF